MQERQIPHWPVLNKTVIRHLPLLLMEMEYIIMTKAIQHQITAFLSIWNSDHFCIWLDKKPKWIFPLFWSIFCVFFVLNLLFIISELYLRGGWIYPYMNAPTICFFTFIEIIVITILSKNFKVSGHICCTSRLFIVRAVHCYALCNMLWFAHRVTNCFIVSIYL